MTHTTSYSDTSTRELRHVLAWADQNNLKLNFSKSKEIKFTSCGMRSKSVTIPSPCMWQVTCITVHDVMLNDKPSAADQLPCDHWLSVSSLQDVFQQTVLASITYCVPFCLSLCSANHRAWLDALLWCSKHYRYCADNIPMTRHHTSFWQLKRLVTLSTHLCYTNNDIYLSIYLSIMPVSFVMPSVPIGF